LIRFISNDNIADISPKKLNITTKNKTNKITKTNQEKKVKKKKYELSHRRRLGGTV